MSSPIVGPIAPENNPPINPQYYQPRVFTISALSLGITTLVTTSLDHNYVVGQQVRFLIPSYYGTYQLSGISGYVTSIPAANQVVVNVNSKGFNAFIASPTFGPTLPQIIAIGDNNSGNLTTTGRISNTYIPGSFINISPA